MRRDFPGEEQTIAGLTGAAAVAAVTLAPTASADYDTSGYINALDAAGLIDHDGDPCNIVDGFCHGQFDAGPSSVSTGVWVCQQVEQGRSRDSSCMTSAMARA